VVDRDDKAGVRVVVDAVDGSVVAPARRVVICQIELQFSPDSSWVLGEPRVDELDGCSGNLLR
jgi:hypothetical protein